MSESQKSSPNMPAILVVLLAVFGLGTFPLGGGKVSDSSPKGPESAKPAGDSQDSTDAENEKNLGPLATIMADRDLQPTAEKPDQC